MSDPISDVQADKVLENAYSLVETVERGTLIGTLSIGGAVSIYCAQQLHAASNLDSVVVLLPAAVALSLLYVVETVLIDRWARRFIPRAEARAHALRSQTPTPKAAEQSNS